jgi:hypothetical protein
MIFRIFSIVRINASHNTVSKLLNHRRRIPASHLWGTEHYCVMHTDMQERSAKACKSSETFYIVKTNI